MRPRPARNVRRPSPPSPLPFISQVVLAEFGYGGKLMPTFPFLDPTIPRLTAWWLKTTGMPIIYYDLMAHGIETFAWPTIKPATTSIPKSGKYTK